MKQLRRWSQRHDPSFFGPGPAHQREEDAQPGAAEMGTFFEIEDEQHTGAAESIPGGPLQKRSVLEFYVALDPDHGQVERSGTRKLQVAPREAVGFRFQLPEGWGDETAPAASTSQG